MGKREVTCCSDCPFYHFYSDYELGEFAECSLEEKTLKNDEVLIDLSPQWCPLLKEDYQITHKDKEQK